MHVQSLTTARTLLARGKLEVFSFDVFDTVLLRRCTSPEAVFERAFQLAPIPAGRQAAVESFVQNRKLAETKARKAAVASGESPEIHIADIYRHFPTTVFGLKRDAWTDLVEAEFQAECELCFANPDIVALITETRAKGIRTGFLSDTYWNSERLAHLLRICAPGLEWDFLYASCDHRSGKSEQLFAKLLADRHVDAKRVAHMGDNPRSDVRSAQRHGIQAVAYPQASAQLAAIFEREGGLFPLVCGQNTVSRRLDRGLRTLRRRVAAWAPEDTPAFTYGTQILGPVMAAFDHFVANRLEDLKRGGGTAAMLFLARDGLLPFQVWQANHDDDAGYCEINRRIALIAGSGDTQPLVELFRQVPLVNRMVTKSVFKTEPIRMAHFMEKLEGQSIPGKDFADLLPSLLTDSDIAEIAGELRAGIMAHLRAIVSDFDHCTDLILVDLGYGGSVQKGLRAILDQETLPHRLHGLYLITEDSSLHELDERDTAEGLLADWVMPPHVKRALLNNISIVEQICSAPEGSVSQYARDGSVRRENDPRPQAQLGLCADIRRGAAHYIQAVKPLMDSGYPDPLATEEDCASWAGTILARALLLPTDAELALLGTLKHDVNLGSQALAPMVSVSSAHSFVAAQSLSMAFSLQGPPMWPAASMAALSPLHGYLYALNGVGSLFPDVVGELPCGEAEVTLLNDRQTYPLKATCLRDGFGHFRLRIPVLKNSNVAAIAIPAEPLPAEGQVRSLALQQGDDVLDATSAKDIVELPFDKIAGLNMPFADGAYRAEPQGTLLLRIPPLEKKIGLITLTIEPPEGSRILAF